MSASLRFDRKSFLHKMSNKVKAKNSKIVKKLAGSGKHSSPAERLFEIIAGDHVEKPSTAAMLEYLHGVMEDKKTSNFMLQATVENISWLEFGTLMNVSMDARNRSKLFGKEAEYQEDGKFKAPWKIYKEKLQFSVKVPKEEYLQMLPTEGEDQDAGFVLPVKVMMNVKVLPYLGFPKPDSAGMALSLVQPLEVIEEKEKKSRKRVRKEDSIVAESEDEDQEDEDIDIRSNESPPPPPAKKQKVERKGKKVEED